MSFIPTMSKTPPEPQQAVGIAHSAPSADRLGRDDGGVIAAKPACAQRTGRGTRNADPQAIRDLGGKIALDHCVNRAAAKHRHHAGLQEQFLATCHLSSQLSRRASILRHMRQLVRQQALARGRLGGVSPAAKPMQRPRVKARASIARAAAFAESA